MNRKAAAALGILIPIFFLLVAIFWLRPISLIHGPLMWLYKYPLLWFMPLVGLAILFLLVLIITYFSKKQNEYYSEGLLASAVMNVGPPALVIVPLLFFIALIISPMLTGKAIYKHYAGETIEGLPVSSETRIMPRAVANVLARNGFSSPTEALENIHIIRSPDGLVWTFGQAPDGGFRRITKKTQGTATLPADITTRQLKLQNKEYEVAPAHLWSDSVTWMAYKKHFFTEVSESVFLPEAGKILVPYIGYEGFPVRVPVLRGAYLLSPDGSVEDLSPEEARKVKEVEESGRLFPESLARRVQDSYKYVNGIWNRLFTHEDVLTVQDSDVDNSQPHYLIINGRGTWVSVAEAWGRSDAIGGVFFTDALTGATKLWRAGRSSGLTSSGKAADATRALAIPGVSFRSGDFRAIEPRPIFRDGQIRFLVSIVPGNLSTVSKSVIVDPRSNRVVAIFNHSTDPDADQALQDYLDGKGQEISFSETGETGKAPIRSRDSLLQQLLRQVRAQEKTIEELLRQPK